ncbi:GTP 3',8-cyclase MoaA [Dietzia timorensis]|uniref:GTP 3',8-cyclase n=1 Tax=Dietzia timorensis TaxID=499555 RepID=A0A173LRC8_9ACTN|nr:GTP 3',8-cyclase MoaA [Dietzia timorensis]ANI93552.1 Cyclic pyranopterin monophosphate synthase [Dietzia timorensis]
MLLDTFGRVARDLRVSLTEKCNLRCTYCMPAEGLPLVPADRLMTSEEVIRLVDLAIRDLGIAEVRFTGGEPLLRRDLEHIVARCHELHPAVPLAITTNALGLAKRADALAAAGLTRVNISLDTVDRATFERVTRRDRVDASIAGVRAAKAAGLGPVKVNAVAMRETLAGAPELLQFCMDEGAELRFIEQMPLEAEQTWQRGAMVTADELLAVLSEHFELTPVGRDDPAAPAERWQVDGGAHTVGIIASVTRQFCAACDRTRVTAEGTVRPCLFGDDETDLLTPLRAGASDEEIGELWKQAMWGKWAGHGGLTDDRPRAKRTMGGIGG